MVDRVLYAVQVHLGAVHQQGARDIRAVAFPKDAHGKLGASRAHQAADPDHLAPPDVDIDPVADLAPLIERMEYCPVAHFHADIPNFRFAPGEPVGQLAANHPFDDPFLAEIVHPFDECFNRGAVADHRDLVRHIRNLVQLVGDDDTGHTLRLELQHQIKQLLRIGLVERRGRLVEDQQLDVLGERLCDLNQLLFAHADVLNQRAR